MDGSSGSWASFLDTSATSHSSNPTRSFHSSASARERALQQQQQQQRQGAVGSVPAPAQPHAPSFRAPKRVRDEVDDGPARWEEEEEQLQGGGAGAGAGAAAASPSVPSQPLLQRYASADTDRWSQQTDAASRANGGAGSGVGTPQRRSYVQPQKRQHLGLHVDPAQQPPAHAHSAASSPFLRTQHAHLSLPQGMLPPSASLPASLSASPALFAHPGCLLPPHTPLPSLSSAASSPMPTRDGSIFAQMGGGQAQQQQPHMMLFGGHVPASQASTPQQQASGMHSSMQQSATMHSFSSMEIQQQPPPRQQTPPQPAAAAIPCSDFRPMSAPAMRPIHSVALSASQCASLSRDGSCADARLTAMGPAQQQRRQRECSDSLSSPPSSPVHGLSPTSLTSSSTRMLRTYSSNGSLSGSGVLPPLSVSSSLQSSHPNSPVAAGAAMSSCGWGASRGRSGSMSDQPPTFHSGSPASPACAPTQPYTQPTSVSSFGSSHATAASHCAPQPPASSPVAPALAAGHLPAAPPFPHFYSDGAHGTVEVGFGVLSVTKEA